MSSAGKILTIAALATSLLTGPAFAQFGAGGGGEKEKTGPQLEDEAKAKRNAEIDKEYSAMRKHTLDAQKATKIDPWQNMRAPTDGTKR